MLVARVLWRRSLWCVLVALGAHVVGKSPAATGAGAVPMRAVRMVRVVMMRLPAAREPSTRAARSRVGVLQLTPRGARWRR